MLKKLLIAPVAALLLAGAARATAIQTLTLDQSQLNGKGLHADVVEVQTHRTAAGIIAQDAIYGGIAGLAIGGGVALLNGGDNWGRDLMVGTGAGLLIGGVFGAVDAASNADRAYPIGESRDRGFHSAFSPLSGKF
jgi:hypothetical protein